MQLIAMAVGKDEEERLRGASAFCRTNLNGGKRKIPLPTAAGATWLAGVVGSALHTKVGHLRGFDRNAAERRRLRCTLDVQCFV